MNRLRPYTWLHTYTFLEYIYENSTQEIFEDKHGNQIRVAFEFSDSLALVERKRRKKIEEKRKNGG